MTEISARSPAEELVAKLRAIQVFSDLPQDDLLWFVSKGEEHRAAVGDIIMREGEPADRMMVILEGEMRARSEHGNPDGPVFTVRGGEVTDRKSVV
jgi:CRP-like cAMP-binding protein